MVAWTATRKTVSSFLGAASGRAMAIFAAVIGAGGVSVIAALDEMSLSTGSKAALGSSTELLPLFIAHPLKKLRSQLEITDGNVRGAGVVLGPDFPAEEKR